jgi:hypothetical protein
MLRFLLTHNRFVTELLFEVGCLGAKRTLEQSTINVIINGMVGAVDFRGELDAVKLCLSCSSVIV